MYQILIRIVSKNQFQTFFSNGQVPSSKQNIISNKIRSQIRSVHGTKHHETTFTNGPNDRKWSKIFEKLQQKFKKLDIYVIQKRKHKIEKLWPSMYQILKTIVSEKQFQTILAIGNLQAANET